MAPQLSANDFTFCRIAWEAQVILPSWAGFQTRGRNYASREEGGSCDGSVRLCIVRPEVSKGLITNAELDAANWVLSRESAISAALLRALVPEYDRTRGRWEKRYRGDDFAAVMPVVHGPDDFRSLMGLAAVYIHPPLRDGVAYAGFVFGCTWDPEHGLGALMRGTDPVTFGGADVAFSFYPPEDV